MKQWKFPRWILVVAACMCVACDDYTSADEHPNKRPGTGTDPTPVSGDITSIQSLNGGTDTVNSHADEWANSSLELDYRRSLTLESPVLSAVNAMYPRLKKLANDTYLLTYQQGAQAWNVYHALSQNLITWQDRGALFESATVKQSNGVTDDTRCFSSCDAVVLTNGNVLAFASFRLNAGYVSDPKSNGIMMRRSTDNGRTWTSPQVIYSGTCWEPYALQLRSGEVQVYFTDNNPVTGDSGTSLLRSTDNGRTWKTVGKIIRQYTGTAIDGSGGKIYSDQMASARELNVSGKIAVANETRFYSGSTSTYNVSMAWSLDNWTSAPLTGEQEGPAQRSLNFIAGGASPYLVQFPSGETVLSYNLSSVLTMCVGDAEAATWGEAFAAFGGKGYWGAMEIVNAHTLAAVMPETYTNTSGVAAARIQLGEFVLNHRVNASEITPKVDADKSDWTGVSDALFIGSVSPSQVAFRFAYDADNLYCLVERLDKTLTSDDSIDLYFEGGDAAGKPFKLTLIPDAVANTVKCSLSTVQCAAAVYGVIGDTSADTGYVVELAIPLKLLRVADTRILFNAVLYDLSGSDTFTRLNTANYSKWLPVVLKNATPTPPQPIEGDNGTGPSWGEGDPTEW